LTAIKIGGDQNVEFRRYLDFLGISLTSRRQQTTDILCCNLVYFSQLTKKLLTRVFFIPFIRRCNVSQQTSSKFSDRLKVRKEAVAELPHSYCHDSAVEFVWRVKTRVIMRPSCSLLTRHVFMKHATSSSASLMWRHAVIATTDFFSNRCSTSVTLAAGLGVGSNRVRNSPCTFLQLILLRPWATRIESFTVKMYEELSLLFADQRFSSFCE